MPVKLIFPIPTSRFRLARGPITYLSDTHFVSQVEPADLGEIVRRCPESLQPIAGRPFRCIYYVDPDPATPLDHTSQTERLALTFSMNNFAEGDPLRFPVGISIERVNARNIVKFYLEREPSSWIGPEANYRFSSRYKVPELKAFFSIVRTSAYRSRRAAASLRWYNSSLERERLEDSIIDLCVALETLSEETTELSFRLSLFLAHAVGSRDDIESAFLSFRELYDVRSRIVHGASHDQKAAKRIEEFREKMGKVRRYAQGAIFYYCYFVNNDDENRWKKHCENMSLGLESNLLAKAS